MADDKIIVRFDGVILNSIEACMRKTKWNVIDGFIPVAKAKPLSKGLLVHDGMKAYYNAIKEGISRREAIDAMIAFVRMKSLKSDLPVPECEAVVSALLQYGQFQVEDTWTPLAIEQPFSYVLFEDDDFQILHEGIVDLIIADVHIKMAVVDHKSSSRNGRVSSMSNQFKGYSRAFKTHNVIVNKIGFQKTLPPSEKFVRALLSYPQSVIDEWEQKAIRRVKRYVQDMKDGNWEANETSCDKYSGCIYRDVCEQTPSVREQFLIQNYRLRGPWDPFKRDDEDD